MTTHAGTIPDAGADIRWREWQARGAEGDRRTAARARIFLLLAAAAVAVWLAVVLV